MLIREKVIAALESKRPDFEDFAKRRRSQRSLIDARLKEFWKWDAATIRDRLADHPFPGALPTFEFDQATRLCLKFPCRWRNHEEARAWALQTLHEQTVIAVDGSQITPTRDDPTPIGAVQIAWFINEHRRGGSYVKDVEFQVIPPSAFEEEEESTQQVNAAALVNQTRFERECLKLGDLMVEYSSHENTAKPLCLFDGSFIVSFAAQLQASSPLLRSYFNHIQDLLLRSQKLQIPLLGFVDSSLSHDLSTMVGLLLEDGEGSNPTDGALLGAPLLPNGDSNPDALLPNWGDRTPFFICARDDKLSRDPRNEGLAAYYRDIAFCYIHLAADRPPARLELPRWVLDSGNSEQVVNLLRAECIVGAGYPYAIETADATAVISVPERERFYALLQQFLGEEDTFTQPRKLRSKLVRR